MSGKSGQEAGVELLTPLDSEARKRKEDCLACRLTGSAGLFLISIYVFSNVRKQTSRTNKQVINLVGAG